MISVFQIFKIILGTVIGMFFLYFLLSFTGLYKGFQEESIDITHLSNLKATMMSVYTSDTDLDIDLEIGVLYRPPEIIGRSKKSSFPIDIPFLFFLKGADKEKVIIYKSSLDQGFFDLEFIGVLPKTKVLYNPVLQEDKTYKILNKLTKLFPNTNKPQIRFGFCTADYETSVEVDRDKLITEYTGVLEDQKVLDQVKAQLNFQLCTARFTDKVVVIFGEGVIPDNGFLVRPATENSGEIFFIEDGEDKVLTYKDELDIFAVIFGGEAGYRYKNKIQLETLEAASRKEFERAEKLAVIYLDPVYGKFSCSPLFSDAKTLLENLNTKVKDLQTTKNQQLTQVIEFDRNLDQIREKYVELENQGCE